MISYSDFTWKTVSPYMKCYLGKEFVGEIYHEGILLPNYGGWYIRWPDGTTSKDYYNADRAKDNLMKYEVESRNMNTKSELE